MLFSLVFFQVKQHHLFGCVARLNSWVLIRPGLFVWGDHCESIRPARVNPIGSDFDGF